MIMGKSRVSIFVLLVVSAAMHASARDVPNTGGDQQSTTLHATAPLAADSPAAAGLGDKKNFIYGGVGGFAGVGGYAGVGGILPTLGGLGGIGKVGGIGAVGGIGGGLGGLGGGLGGAASGAGVGGAAGAGAGVGGGILHP